MNMLARWLFRRIVRKRVLAYMVHDKLKGGVQAFAPDEVDVVFRGR